MKELVISNAKRIVTGDKTYISFELPPSLVYVARDLFLDGKKKTDDHYEVKVRLRKRNRSTGKGSASNHFHGHAAQIASETGYTLDQMKYVLKCEAAVLGYPSEMFRGMIIPQSEADASPEEESMLIETAHRIAAELGIILQED